ncbi:MAG: ABC transporter ATP-binding protein [Caulobacterales bacterium]|nr:ABC transporter ATP-binding protein [Caulobacterales bacterium]
MSGEVVMEARGLVTRFGPQVVHDGLDLEVRAGEILGLVGGSGTGKSVLLNTFIGLKPPDGGDIAVFGRRVASLSRAERTAVERRWGVLFQNGALFSSLTVKENVEAPMREHADLGEELRGELADLKIALVGLPAEAGAKLPSELSGGMRKRAGLARAIALDPDILFLDEPTAGLDPIGAAEFDQLILDLRAALGLTVFMVTHDLDSLHAICDRVAVLAEKRVIANAPIAELLRSNHPWITEYFHGPRGRAARGGGE